MRDERNSMYNCKSTISQWHKLVSTNLHIQRPDTIWYVCTQASKPSKSYEALRFEQHLDCDYMPSIFCTNKTNKGIHCPKDDVLWSLDYGPVGNVPVNIFPRCHKDSA